MRILFGTLLCLLLASCSNVERKEGPAEKSEDHLRNWSLANEQRQDDVYKKYVQEVFYQFNNKYKLDERDGCYSLSRVKIELILHISKRGLIERVSGWPENKKLQCFKKIYTGLRLPAQPDESMLLNMIMM